MFFSKDKIGGKVEVVTPDAGLFTGFVEGRGETFPIFSNPNVTLRFDGKPNLGWATVTLARITKDRYLLVATGEMTNTGMRLEHLGGDRVTVGKKWGMPPVLCEGVAAKLFVRSAPQNSGIKNRVRCWALDESGNRKQEIVVVEENGAARLAIKPEYKTLWYEIQTVPRP
jgi:hypothetical protein